MNTQLQDQAIFVAYSPNHVRFWANRPRLPTEPDRLASTEVRAFIGAETATDLGGQNAKPGGGVAPPVRPSRFLSTIVDIEMGTTPYPELNQVLDELVSRIEQILGSSFVGAYLQGSFAVGDFDRHSDVDFIVVDNRGLCGSSNTLWRRAGASREDALRHKIH